MSSMLKAARSTAFLNRISTNGSINKRTKLSSASTRLMATQSGDDTKPPSALAKLHLEDGSTLTGRSFGCHESMTGEVRFVFVCHVICIYFEQQFALHIICRLPVILYYDM